MAQTILVVDDETELADTYSRVLSESGFTCLIAYDGAAALSLFDSEHPALIFSDINLPSSSGFEIAEYVRQKSPDTPVILTTAYENPNTAEQVARAGAAGFLRKPFSNSDLISIVKSVIGVSG